MSTPYNLLEAHRAEKYVFKQFYYLPHTALHIYAGIKFLEEKQKGFCRPVIADYRTIARVSNVNKNSVKNGLLKLMDCGLVKGEIGSPVKEDKKATILTRVNVDDLRRNSPDKVGIAQKLADALNKRSFMFEGKMTQPIWGVGITGRVNSSKPNIQGIKEPVRAKGLREGLPVGHTLVYSDIKSADPTVIKHILGMLQNNDLYTCYMHATGCDKPTAKKKVNMLAYVRNSLAVFKHWPEAARNDPVLSDYAKKLHNYKTDLFKQSRETRSVTTLTGRLIVGEEGKRLNAGNYFNWKVQGTVADIVNAAALELIAMPEVKTVLPMHDAVYVVCAGGRGKTIEATLCTQAQSLGIKIQVKTEVHAPSEGCATSAS